MSFQVQIRKDEAGVCGANVRIEFAGGSAEATTDADGFVTFDRGGGSVTIYLDGQKRGTYDPDDTQSVTIMM